MRKLLTRPRKSAAAADGRLSRRHQFLGGGATKMGRGDGSQYLVHCLHSSLRYRLGMRIRFEYCQGTGQAGISKDLVELRKKHHHQGLDLVLIAGSLFAQLGVQTHQFAVRSDLLARNIAHAAFPTEQNAGNGHRI
jgi:hypothetical protein